MLYKFFLRCVRQLYENYFKAHVVGRLCFLLSIAEYKTNVDAILPQLISQSTTTRNGAVHVVYVVVVVTSLSSLLAATTTDCCASDRPAL